MTYSMEAPMTEEPADYSGLKEASITAASALGLLVAIAAAIGFLVGHEEAGGGPFKLLALVFLAACVALGIASAYGVWRSAQRFVASDRGAAKRDMLNRNVMIASFVLGGVMSALLIAGMEWGEGDGSIFSSTPIPAWAAIGLVALIVVTMPPLLWFWHQHVIDEQEAEAYRAGSVAALYFFMLAAPVWWLLWRGQVLPAPDGIVLYFSTTFIAGAVWFWKKYR